MGAWSTALANALLRIVEYLDANVAQSRCRCPTVSAANAGGSSSTVSAVGKGLALLGSSLRDTIALYATVVAVLIAVVAFRAEISALLATVWKSRQGRPRDNISLTRDTVTPPEPTPRAKGHAESDVKRAEEAIALRAAIDEERARLAMHAKATDEKLAETESVIAELSVELEHQATKRQEAEALAQMSLEQLTSAQQHVNELSTKLESTMAYAIALEQRVAVKLPGELTE